METVFVDQLVFGLCGAETVEVDLLEFIFGGVGAGARGGGIVAAVIEPSVAPAGSAELDPFDFVGELSARGDLHDMDIDPVRARFRDGVGGIAVVFGEGDRVQGHGTVIREGVGVEEDLGRSVQPFLVVEDALVLQTVIFVEKVVLSDTERGSLLRVIVELGEPFANLVTVGYLAQVILRDGILCADPFGRFGRVVVFEPTVGVCDYRPVVVVAHGGVATGLGIGFRLNGHGALATGGRCRHQRQRAVQIAFHAVCGYSWGEASRQTTLKVRDYSRIFRFF